MKLQWSSLTEIKEDRWVIFILLHWLAKFEYELYDYLILNITFLLTLKSACVAMLPPCIYEHGCTHTLRFLFFAMCYFRTSLTVTIVFTSLPPPPKPIIFLCHWPSHSDASDQHNHSSMGSSQGMNKYKWMVCLLMFMFHSAFNKTIKFKWFSQFYFRRIWSVFSSLSISSHSKNYLYAKSKYW